MINNKPESLLTAKKCKLSKESMAIFLKCYSYSAANDDVPNEFLTDFIVRVLMRRLEAYSISVDKWLIVLISTLCENPAYAVIWAYTLKQMQKQFNTNHIDFGTFTRIDAFGDGFPIEEEYKRIWDAQKGDGSFGGNKLDNPIYWE